MHIFNDKIRVKGGQKSNKLPEKIIKTNLSKKEIIITFNFVLLNILKRVIVKNVRVNI